MLYSVIVVVMYHAKLGRSAVQYNLVVVLMYHPKQGSSGVQYNCGGGDVSPKTRQQCCTV